MSFFEPPPPPPEPPAQPPWHPWQGPPGGVIGATLPLDLVIGRADKAAIWIPALTVYPQVFEFAVEIRHRLDEEPEHPFFLHHQLRRRRPAAGGELPAELLRLGIEFADGRKATNLGQPFRHLSHGDPDSPPEGPLLQPAGGGGGGGGRWHHGFYVWPLPPVGALAFVCEWPAAGIALTRVEIDADPILTVASQAVTLWDEQDLPGPQGSSTVQLMRKVSAPAPQPALDWLEANKDELAAKLRALGVETCPACGSGRLQLAPDPLDAAASTGILVRFTCDRCGHVAFFDAAKLGFTP